MTATPSEGGSALDRFLDNATIHSEGSLQRRSNYELRAAARLELAALRTRVSALEGALRHAIQSSHGHKPDACSACSAADTLLQPPTPTENK